MLKATFFRPKEELYDLEKDPYEMTNLAGLEEYKATVTKLGSVLDQWMEKTNDDGDPRSHPRRTFFRHDPLNVIYKNPEDGLPFTPHSAISLGDYKFIFDWYGQFRLFNIREDIPEKNNLAKLLPAKTRDLFQELMNYLEKNVEKKYWPSNNPNYDPKTELRKVPYIDLYKAYKAGKDVVTLAN